MNLFNLLREIEQTDADAFERPSLRREAMKQFARFSKKVTLASLPLAVGSVFKKAYSQTSIATVEPVLQFVLSLEYLQAEFYSLAIAAPALIPAGPDLTAITRIRDQQTLHVNFLTTALETLGSTPAAKPKFDFSGGKGSGTGAYADVFSNYNTFLALAQIFEDTGLRAYKGQIPELLRVKEITTEFLNIHSVEARHAAHIRLMRMARGANVKPWITGNESGIGTEVLDSYKGEENQIQGGITIGGIKGLQISVTALSEAFDEPLTKGEVLAIVALFIAA